MSVLNCIIRREEERDYEEISEVIEKAFKSMAFSDHKEQFLVERIRKSADFIPELSLVACYKGDVVGHILFSKISKHHFKLIVDTTKTCVNFLMGSYEFQNNEITM